MHNNVTIFIIVLYAKKFFIKLTSNNKTNT